MPQVVEDIHTPRNHPYALTLNACSLQNRHVNKAAWLQLEVQSLSPLSN
jgi:hypothetical protein